MTEPTMTDDASIRGYKALTEKCGFVDFCARTQIEFTGDDRVTFLHNLCTNDIKLLQAGDGCEAYVTSVRGKIIAHAFVFCTPSSLVLETASGQGDSLMAHFDRYLITEDVQLHDRTCEWCEYLLSGPQAMTVLAALGVSDAPLSQQSHCTIHVGKVEAWLRRVPILSAPTFLIGAAVADSDVLKQAFQSADAVECNLESFHMARLETGFPWFPVDVNEDNLPQEVARDEQAISFNKGCYLGQETVARLDAMGHVNRMLTGIKIDDASLPVVGAEITSDGQVVGKITSVTYSPRLQTPIALTVLRCSALKSPLQVSGSSASVVPLPLV